MREGDGEEGNLISTATRLDYPPQSLAGYELIRRPPLLPEGYTHTNTHAHTLFVALQCIRGERTTGCPAASSTFSPDQMIPTPSQRGHTGTWRKAQLGGKAGRWRVTSTTSHSVAGTCRITKWSDNTTDRTSHIKALFSSVIRHVP